MSTSMTIPAEDLQPGDVMLLPEGPVEVLQAYFNPRLSPRVEVHVDRALHGWEYTTFSPKIEVKIERGTAP